VSTDDVVLEPGERATVGTGLKIALPNGYVGFVVPRSGLAMKHGITIVNSPGTVDAGYRGEIRVTLLNTDARDSYAIAAGDRIGQLIVMPVPSVRFVEVERLPGSDRGEGGFGSTGYGTSDSTTGATTS
jgi:dUTP pyrophosphatase